ncbi:hypothetical protein IP364_07530 [Helicobacter winghamensis]|uniref:hypothetical protein n=1 Tax=Helicobacter winghamensis TaxID=157268 RepID=UPI00279AB54A
MQEVIKRIQKNIDLWNFDLVELIYLENYQDMDREIRFEFYNFLYLTGGSDKYDLLFPQEDKKNDKVKALLEMKKELQGIEIGSKDMELVLLDSRIPKDILSCNLLRRMYCQSQLEVKKVWSLYERFIRNSSESLTRNWFTSKMIQLFSTEENKDFFKIKDLSDFRHILLLQLYQINSIGAKIYHKLFVDMYQKNLYLGRNAEFTRFAVCFYGILRGDWQSTLNMTIDNVVKNLNADIFLFTWDEKQTWQDVRKGGIDWTVRKLTRFLSAHAPKEIKLASELKKNCPNIFNKLAQNIYCKLDIRELENIYNKNINFRKLKVEDQKSYDNKNIDYNDMKMMYGIWSSFELLKEYEKEQNIQYDYVIMMRADCEIDLLNGCNFRQEIEKISPDEFIDVKTVEGGGIGNMIANYHTIEIFASFYKNYKSFVENSLFCRKCSIHSFVFQWMSYHGKYAIKSPIAFRHVFTKCLERMVIPNISRELSKDLSALRDKLGDDRIRLIQAFFETVILQYSNQSNYNSSSNLFDKKEIRTAKSRIQNQLAYKLGQEMIFNSKSLGGYIRMPFVLWNTAQKHKQQQKDYLEKVKKNPSLKLPPLESYLDYKEALKCKDHLSYKLGEALIRADNNRWGGGILDCYLRLES